MSRMNETFRHITLNTGHVADQRRGDIIPLALEALLPIVDAGQGSVPLPEVPLHLDFEFPKDGSARRPGAAFFRICTRPDPLSFPLVLNAACWRPELSQERWKDACERYRSSRAELAASGMWREPSAAPPPGPWMAVWFLPRMMTMPIEIVGMLGDIERCVFWALRQYEDWVEETDARRSA